MTNVDFSINNFCHAKENRYRKLISESCSDLNIILDGKQESNTSSMLAWHN